ncbi:hypothetical protein [Parvularcula maris]|uniref:Uncharacterized protein n=1 Tax=Parvularcula maris TaxID=2965077 RepID=A0A9X2LA31_9PROT|nr:hypothetical protein [Parvularcula maris]MCQ8185935.1 hypothetical protein [Parvularcula maris]
MKKFLESLSDDLRRFGLVLAGGAFLANVDSNAFRIMILALGLTMLLAAYVIVIHLGDDE